MLTPYSIGCTSLLCHYYGDSTGPFRSLTELEPVEGESVLNKIRTQQIGFASKRAEGYLEIRRALEIKARELFLKKGGKPARPSPHYLTVGKCPWLLSWYEKGRELCIPIKEFDPKTISFTYGDLFPTMRYDDGKKYRGQVYTLSEIQQLADELGLPQDWNHHGEKGPERYIEVQVWDDKPLHKWLK